MWIQCPPMQNPLQILCNLHGFRWKSFATPLETSLICSWPTAQNENCTAFPSSIRIEICGDAVLTMVVSTNENYVKNGIGYWSSFGFSFVIDSVVMPRETSTTLLPSFGFRDLEVFQVRHSPETKPTPAVQNSRQWIVNNHSVTSKFVRYAIRLKLN